MNPVHIEGCVTGSVDDSMATEATGRALNKNDRPVRRYCKYCAGARTHCEWWTMPADDYPASVLLCGRCGHTTCFDWNEVERFNKKMFAWHDTDPKAFDRHFTENAVKARALYRRLRSEQRTSNIDRHRP
jgi:hypothetical protein